jgi:heterodisulfide reductase subunit B
MKGISLFLGCIVPNRYPGIEKATRFILDELGIDWSDLDGTSCCPAPGVFRSFDKVSWLALASRNIVLSEMMNRDILTVCNGCYGSLSDANHELKNDPKLAKQINKHLESIDMKFKGISEVRHIVEFLTREVGPQAIKDKIKKPLDLKVAVHYGCHLIKPSKERELGTVEHPSFFDELVEATGATSIDYADKMACCGAGGGVRSALLDKSLAMAEHKFKTIGEVGADIIVNACPFCHLQLDYGQVEVKNMTGNEYNIPVLHYSQLLALALGYLPEEAGIDQNFIKPGNVLVVPEAGA